MSNGFVENSRTHHTKEAPGIWRNFNMKKKKSMKEWHNASTNFARAAWPHGLVNFVCPICNA